MKLMSYKHPFPKFPSQRKVWFLNINVGVFWLAKYTFFWLISTAEIMFRVIVINYPQIVKVFVSWLIFVVRFFFFFCQMSSLKDDLALTTYHKLALHCVDWQFTHRASLNVLWVQILQWIFSLTQDKAQRVKFRTKGHDIPSYLVDLWLKLCPCGDPCGSLAEMTKFPPAKITLCPAATVHS